MPWSQVRSRQRGGRERTGTLAEELQEAVEDEAGTHGHSEERDRAVAVQAREQHVGEELAAAHGAHARDVKRGVDEGRAVEDRHRPHRRRREACRRRDQSQEEELGRSHGRASNDCYTAENVNPAVRSGCAHRVVHRGNNYKRPGRRIAEHPCMLQANAAKSDDVC